MVILCMFLVISVQRSSKSWCSTMRFNTDNDDGKHDEVKEDFDGFLGDKVEELQPQGVDPRRGSGFRGVHKVFDLKLQLRNIMCFFGN
jgi:hypothetical protein